MVQMEAVTRRILQADLFYPARHIKLSPIAAGELMSLKQRCSDLKLEIM